MGKILIPGSSGGGVSSDDVTAKREHVVKGYATITVDSNDEIVEGLIEDRGEGAVVAFAIGREDWNHQIWATFRNGWYHRPPHPAGHEAYIYIKYEALANLLGVDPAKMLESLTVADRRGQIKIIDTAASNYRINKSTNFGIDNWTNPSNPVFYVDFPHGNGYYNRSDGHPHVCIDAINLGTAGADSVLSGQTATSVQGVKFAGAIQRWICTTGDVITALGGEGFVWDDTHASRGRGIVTKILNNGFIQGANWVFLPSPNLQPWNIRQNVNVNGVVGTMVDYGAGGVPFNGATFDGRLASGVANKGFILNGIGRYLNLKNSGNGYKGIVDGGLKLTNGFAYNTSFKSAPDVGFVLSKSINLTPFRQLKVGFRFLRFSGDGTRSQPARVRLEVGVTPISQVGGESYGNESYTILKDIGRRSNEISYEMTSTMVGAGNQSDQSQQYMILDISSSQGHNFVYFMLGNIIHEYSNGNVYAEVIINHIELIN
nr:MAG TPA: hypothetical protein [Caudoviricetes sp.]